MPCYKPTASCTQLVAGSEHWGFADATCCEYHWSEVRKRLQKAPIESSYLDDYAKIFIMMENRKTVEVCMRELAHELGDLNKRMGEQEQGFERYQPRHQNANEGYLKLSTALAKYEAYCWFPPSHELFVGFVLPVDFNKFIARGLLPKDPGAGLEHGDFTHRLHWHAIARVITNRFTRPKSDGWKHTPLELYTSLGAGDAVAANTWFNLIDDNGAKPTFRSPDGFHAHVINGGYGVLSTNVARRYYKRKGEVDKEIDQDELAEAQNDPNPVPDFRYPNTPRTLTRAWDYKLKAYGRAGDAYAQRKQKLYDQMDNLPVLRRSAEQDSLSIQERIARSKSSLNQSGEDHREHTVYNKTLGMLTRRFGRGSKNIKALV